jgi:type I restriction enzyme S subunit
MREGWTETTLGEAAFLNPKESALSIDAPFIPMDAVHVGKRFVQYVEPRGQRTGARASSGDVLFARITPCLENGKVAQVQNEIGRCGGSTEFIVIRGSHIIDSSYVYFWATWSETRNRATRLMTGTTGRQRLSPKDLGAMSLLLPPLAEQRRIVDVVSSVDSYIDALQQQADSARVARNAVLHELLSAGGDDWTETTLDEVGITGLFADGDWVESKDQDPSGEFRLLQLADIGDGVFLDKSNRWMNSEQFGRLRCTPLKPRDILIARMPEPIARACVLPSGLPTCATVVDVAILRCGEGYIPEFVVLVINDSTFRAQAESLLTGTTRQRISRSNLEKIVCRLPSLSEQRRIVGIVSSMDEVIQSTEHAVEQAKLLRSGLLSDLLSGEHEVPESYDHLMKVA